MQRGNNVFDRSIQGLIKLNEAGYGVEGSGLYLDLVYNPLGAFLPPPQEALQAKYKEELLENFGIEFNDLFTMTNMPIKRFADFLYRRGTTRPVSHDVNAHPFCTPAPTPTRPHPHPHSHPHPHPPTPTHPTGPAPLSPPHPQAS